MCPGLESAPNNIDRIQGMAFSHLNSIGRCLLKVNKRSSSRSREGLPTEDVSKDRHNFTLLQQLAVLTIR